MAHTQFWNTNTHTHTHRVNSICPSAISWRGHIFLWGGEPDVDAGTGESAIFQIKELFLVGNGCELGAG